ncbi:MAG TPA: YdcF family protein [Burkholderiales bacterium]|jgi:uncharacterized SAM-binding protein YcdF (DUF218 family)
MIWEIGSILKHAVLPPLGLGWLFLLAWWLMPRRPRTARWLLGVTLLVCYLAATPLAGDFLMRHFVEDRVPASSAQPQAIVVLGGGRGLAFDEHGKVIEGEAAGSTLERLLTGARLQRLTGLPLLVTGGKPDGFDPPEGIVMRDALVGEFKVPVRWVEAASRNTVENARFSAPLLQAAGVKTIFLVTSDFHMRRARALFENQGFAVVPVPALAALSADGRPLASFGRPFSWREVVPTMAAATQTFFACNEMAGMIYSRLSMR